MADKVCINGQMKRIDTTLHKPVIFLNGQKKVLAKAWTFINGEKVQLWGQAGIQVDYIKSDGLVSGWNIAVAIGEDWATLSGSRSGTPRVTRLNIANIDSPTVIQTVNWGYWPRNNTYLSDSNYLVFYGYNYDTHALNRLKTAYSDGTVSVDASYTTAGKTLIGDIGNYSFEYETLTKTFAQPQTLTRQYGTRFYSNGSSAYSVGTQPTSVSDGNFGPRLTTVGLQYDSSNWYGIFLGSGSYSTNSGTWKMGVASASKVSGTSYNMSFLDGNNIVVRGGSSIQLLNKTSLSVVYSGETLTDNGMSFKIIGRNGNYYYVVQYPSTAVAGGVVTLYLFDATDLSTVYTQTLPSDPFNENSGVSSFWNNCVPSPQNTGSGFLAVSGEGNAQIRIVRFSELFI